ncbi:ribonuclease HII [Patescibacteria group bacterium]|nr:ribonuclease HII [Patescibacteria group bacterium]MCG2694472.1 ribonuclease HII [Candidatus Parcubacteria bacterium]
MKSGYKYLIGIDEVGRGPVAGPVAVGALIVSASNLKEVTERFLNFKDSKKLTPKKRNEWFVNIRQAQKEGLLNYKVVFVDNIKIDQFGIVPAIRACIDKSLETLQTVWVSGAHKSDCLVLLDGGLRAPDEFVNQKTIIKGDEKELVIALASIVAKVTRDALMCKFAKEYPEYGFEKHKGYGTKAHMEAIKKYGVCEIHRKSFLKNFLNSKI